MSNFKPRKPRKLRYSIFIICEDKNFGYDYLNSLKIAGKRIKVKPAGTDTDALSIVKKCINSIKNDANKTIAVNADLFCVFDTDKNTQAKINDANTLAKSNDIRLIMNNPCIEYWFLSHHFKSSASITTQEAIKKITKKFNSYCKKCKFAGKDEMLTFLLKNTKQACLFNEKLYKNKEEYLKISNNPSSNMFLLIYKINEN